MQVLHGDHVGGRGSMFSETHINGIPQEVRHAV